MTVKTQHFLHVKGVTWQGIRGNCSYETEDLPMTKNKAFQIAKGDFASVETLELETRTTCSVKFEIRN